jgi:NADH:ubiquinone oxidoreductase subunit C
VTPEQLQERFTDALGDHVVEADVAWDQLTLTLDADGYVEAARLGRDDPALNLDFFDCLSGVDEREDGFAVVAILYSTEHRHRVLLRHPCAGGRDEPTAPSLTGLYLGADWHEREAWDMFGIEFDGHPGLAPRILTTENFEGWPLRKDFHLGTREAKPWPGLKEPLEIDEETGEPLEKQPAGPGGAPGPTAPDEAMAEQAKRAAGVLDEEQVEVAEGTELAPEAPETTATDEGVGAEPDEKEAARVARAREKAAEMRRRKAAERAAEAEDEAAAEDDGGDEEPAAEEPAADEEAPADEPPPTGEAPGEAARKSAVGDPRVTKPADRQQEGDIPRHAQEGPREDERGEVAERVAEASQEREPTHEDVPPQTGPPGAPSGPEGEPYAESDVGEATVEGGLRETVDEEADAAADVTGGRRPGSVEDAPPEDERDRGRAGAEEALDEADRAAGPDDADDEDDDTGEDEAGDETGDGGR